MAKKKTTEEFIEKCEKTFPGKFTYEKTIYTGVHNKVVVTCPVHGDFETIPHNFLRGKGCYYEIGKHTSACVTLGETILSRRGETMEVVYIKNMQDINVKFLETGYIKEHTTAWDFINKTIKDPLYYARKYEGMQNIANNGQLMWISEYTERTKIKVKFEDGTVVDSRMSSFLSGAIANPNFLPAKQTSVNEIILQYYFSKIGFHKAPSGYLKELGRLELDLYNPDINGFKVAIEYDGIYHELEKDKKKNDLCVQNNIILFRVRVPKLEQLNDNGSIDFTIKNPNPWSKYLVSAISFIVSKINEITGSDFSVDVNFKRDRVDIGAVLSKYCDKDRRERLGEIRTMNNGKKAKIVEYNDYSHIVVEFLCDKYRVCTTYGKFIQGKCMHPSFNTRLYNNANKMAGTKFIDRDGVEYEIIGYYSYNDMTFKNLLTGEIIEHVDSMVFTRKIVRSTDHNRFNKAVKATNVKTGEVIVFKSVKDCSEQINALPSNIYTAIWRHSTTHGYKPEYISPDTTPA